MQFIVVDGLWIEVLSVISALKQLRASVQPFSSLFSCLGDLEGYSYKTVGPLPAWISE